MKRVAAHPSHHAMRWDLATWLTAQHVPTLTGVDTRALTISLREHGTIARGARRRRRRDRARRGGARTRTRVRARRRDSSAAWRPRPSRPSRATTPVRTSCCSTAASSARSCAISARSARASRCCPTTPRPTRSSAHEPDGVVISPGPGDPDGPRRDDRGCAANWPARVPMFGVCLGHQLLALACGARTYKLPYGHRGGNQPVKDSRRDTVLVTAHNHGYAVDGASLPGDLEATMVNLNDGTNEGFRHRTLPIAGVQFHPEASPGPFDARYLFASGSLRSRADRRGGAGRRASRRRRRPRRRCTASTCGVFAVRRSRRACGVGDTLHLTMHVHVDEQVAQLDNVTLPNSAGFESWATSGDAVPAAAAPTAARRSRCRRRSTATTRSAR